MSGAVQRLLGRALGTEAGGLKPRVSFRFENFGAAPDPVEVHAERGAPAPSFVPATRGEVRVPGGMASDRAGDRAGEMAPIADPPAETGESNRRGHPARQDPPRGNRPISADISSRETVLAQTRLIMARTPDPAAGTERSPRVMPTSEPLRKPGAPDVAERGDHGEPVPAPLVRVAAHGPLPAMPQLDPSDTNRHAALPGTHHPVEPAAPDITIEIGRLDIRTRTPGPAPAARAAPRKSLPTLGDYLRGARR